LGTDVLVFPVSAVTLASYSAALGVFAIPVAVAMAIRFRRALLSALPFLAAVNGFALRIGGVAVRLDQLVGALLFGVLLISVAAGHRRLFLDRTAIWLCIVAALNVLSTALFAPDLPYSVGQVANLFSTWSIYFVIVNFLDSPEDVDRFFNLCLTAALAESAFGILAFFLVWAGVPITGANLEFAYTIESIAFGSYGTMREPNIFGSFCQIYFVIAIGLWLVPVTLHSRRERLKAVALTAATGLGLVLSFTRGAWLGAGVGVGVLLFLSARYFGVRVRPVRLAVPILLLTSAAMVLWFAPVGAGEFFRYKVRNLLSAESQNAVVRLIAFGLSYEQILQRPILGWGTHSFAALVSGGLPYREIENWQNLWIGNFVLLFLHDTGLVGLVAFISLLVTLFSDAARSLGRIVRDMPTRAGRQTALLAAAISILVPFLFTTGFTLGYSWLLFGLLGVYSRMASQNARPSPTPLSEAVAAGSEAASVITETSS
jgi:hypothetical protein